MHKYLGVLALMLLMVFSARCNLTQIPAGAAGNAAAKAKTEEAQIIVPVQAELPRRDNISSYFETTARVEAENRVQVMAEGVGECEKVLAQEGDSVKAGDVLAELDRKTILATIGQAEVQVRQTKTAYDIAERSLAEGIGAKAERDNAQFAHEQSLAALNTQKVQLAKLTVCAQISGIVTKKNIQEGQLVSAATPVFTIVDPGSYMLVINPPEKELARLKVGQVAKVTVDALGNEEFDAAVRRINPGVDSATGTVKVTLDFDAATRKRLRESAFARVRLVLETHENALLIPKDALVEENARKYLFIVKQEEEKPESGETAPAESSPGGQSVREAAAEPAESQAAQTGQSPAQSPSKAEEQSAKPVFAAERIEIQTGLEDSKNIEILSGLDDQALVVTLGQHTLKPGSKVTVTNATDEILSKAGLSAEEALKTAREKRAGEAAVKGPRVVRQHRDHH